MKNKNIMVPYNFEDIDEMFFRTRKQPTPYQKKRGSLKGLTSIYVPEEQMWIFTKHPKRKKQLIKKYVERYKGNIINISKFD